MLTEAGAAAEGYIEEVGRCVSASLAALTPAGSRIVSAQMR